jgi:DNA-binding SARP family transcriptional activator
VAVGQDHDGFECFVDLHAVGTLVVSSTRSSAILRSLAASLAWSPFMDHGSVLTVGIDSVVAADRTIERFASMEAAAQRSDQLLDEPVAVLVDTNGLAESTQRPGSLLRQIGERPAPFGLVIDHGHAPCRIVERDGEHIVEPWGWKVAPPTASAELLAAASSVVEQANRPLERIAPVVPIDPPERTVNFSEPEWHLMVRLLGQVEVVSADGASVPFERSKALELVVWLAVHRERPTRSKARAALWETSVTAATFSNVVSDARRSMARVVPPPSDDEWVARTLTDEMSLHPLVLTDADLLALRVEAARRMPSYEAIDVLRPGLELVAGLPFESSSYLWPDAEGHTSALVLLATDAASELAAHYLALGDIDGVFWATGQGLKVLSAHEELIGMRMRAHAARGDRSGVRHEWESYERALAADPWSAADPSPKLVALRADLLTSDAWPTGSRAASA